MGNNSTARSRRCAGLLLVAATAAACAGGDPDPRVVRRSLALRGDLPPAVETTASPVVAAMFDVAFSAPAGETQPAGRQAQRDREAVIVAVGRNAAASADATVEQAFARTCADLAPSFVACPDRDAVELMMTGRVDLALLGGSLSAREQHAGLRQTRLGVELFALVVAPDFPADSLSRTQIRQLLAGEVADWQQLGYDRGPVVVVVPADPALAERAQRALILGDRFAAGAIRVGSDLHVADQLLQKRGAIGVVRITGAMAIGQKLLQIDWTPPTVMAFDYGNYPYGVPLHLVTSGQPADAAMRFLEFARSDDGRELLGRTLAPQ